MRTSIPFVSSTGTRRYTCSVSWPKVKLPDALFESRLSSCVDIMRSSSRVRRYTSKANALVYTARTLTPKSAASFFTPICSLLESSARTTRAIFWRCSGREKSALICTTGAVGSTSASQYFLAASVSASASALASARAEPPLPVAIACRNARAEATSPANACIKSTMHRTEDAPPSSALGLGTPSSKATENNLPVSGERSDGIGFDVTHRLRSTLSTPKVSVVATPFASRTTRVRRAVKSLRTLLTAERRVTRDAPEGAAMASTMRKSFECSFLAA
mmetsp:Transcript_21960/g.53747  ORF Transcript_21960/g.53747 Transcript_21960/m.53747 type:complete len:276 (+) Transcript_21960:4221-5048(+)